MKIDIEAPIYVAGHKGMVGSALLRELERVGHKNFVVASSKELDLRERSNVFEFFSKKKPKYVILAAAKVGGIAANNSHPVEFLSENLQIQTNVMDAALENRVEKLIFLGSSCIYPKYAPQPIREDALLTGELEITNEAYAIAKISGIKYVQAVQRQHGLNWISVMPSNLYGPGDYYNPHNSHVIPALINRYSMAVNAQAKEVTNWGTGSPLREFLYVEDLANAINFLLHNYNGYEHINVGAGYDMPIREIASLVAEQLGFEGDTNWDSTKPDGTPKKLLDISKIKSLGWEPKVSFLEGLRITVDDYLATDYRR
jgi:GDP-L-fucose synthase